MVTLLSPFAGLEGSSFVNLIITYGNILIDDLRPSWLHVYKSFKNPSVISHGFKMVCGYASFVCEFQSHYMSHSTDIYNDNDKMKIFFSKYPAQSSFKNWQYFKQLFNSKKPHLYDFGEEENFKRYGQNRPPAMNLTKAGEAGVPI